MRYVRIATVILFIISVAFFGYVKYAEQAKIDDTLPTISGPAEPLEIPCDYTEEDLLKGLSAHDEKDGDITDEIMVDNLVPSLEKGKCKVNYVVFDSSNHPATFSRDIIFTDYRSPRIYLSAPLVFQKNTNVDIFEYIGAEDVIDGDITSLLRMNTNTNMVEEGTYIINAEATNSLGDFAKLEIPVHIIDTAYTRLNIKLTENVVYIKTNDAFNPQKYIESVTKTDGTVQETDIVKVESNVNTSKPGVYEVIYTAEQNASTKGLTSLLVIVE